MNIQSTLFPPDSLPEIKADLIIVPVSGGKDSQACLKLAVGTGKKVVGMFNDTRFEHPFTYAHIDRIEQLYGVEIHRVNEGSSVEQEILKPKDGKRYFPGMRHRFCTRELKVRPCLLYTSPSPRD